MASRSGAALALDFDFLSHYEVARGHNHLFSCLQPVGHLDVVAFGAANLHGTLRWRSRSFTRKTF